MRDDEAEFAAFYERTRPACQRAVRATVGNAGLAEELVAEAYARAWASWPKVRRHPAPEAWVVRTCLNAHVSWWRRHRRETAWPDALDPSAPVAEGQALDSRLLSALRQLPVRQREVIVLRVFLDLDSHATAQAMGITPGTVGAHLHRAIKALRDAAGPSPLTPASDRSAKETRL